MDSEIIMGNGILSFESENFFFEPFDAEPLGFDI